MYGLKRIANACLNLQLIKTRGEIIYALMKTLLRLTPNAHLYKKQKIILAGVTESKTGIRKI